MCIRVSASTTLVFVEFSMVNFRLSALQDRQPDSSQGTYDGSSPQVKLSSSSTLWRQQGYYKVIALYLPCQIYALCSGTDARHAASAQEKTTASHNNLCSSDRPRHVCEP